jgi:hypothetical protein
MPYQSYQLWDIARAKTAAEQRAADEGLGKLAAAVSGSSARAAARCAPWRACDQSQDVLLS